MPRSFRRRARSTVRIDGLKVRIIDDPAVSGADLGQALRTLARMMVRSYEAHGDHTAISRDTHSSSKLTVLPHPSPDHSDEAA